MDFPETSDVVNIQSDCALNLNNRSNEYPESADRRELISLLDLAKKENESLKTIVILTNELVETKSLELDRLKEVANSQLIDKQFQLQLADENVETLQKHNSLMEEELNKLVKILKDKGLGDLVGRRNENRTKSCTIKSEVDRKTQISSNIVDSIVEYYEKFDSPAKEFPTKGPCDISSDKDNITEIENDANQQFKSQTDSEVLKLKEQLNYTREELKFQKITMEDQIAKLNICLKELIEDTELAKVQIDNTWSAKYEEVYEKVNQQSLNLYKVNQEKDDQCIEIKKIMEARDRLQFQVVKYKQISEKRAKEIGVLKDQLIKDVKTEADRVTHYRAQADSYKSDSVRERNNRLMVENDRDRLSIELNKMKILVKNEDMGKGNFAKEQGRGFYGVTRASRSRLTAHSASAGESAREAAWAPFS